jgi:hypothetical protein
LKSDLDKEIVMRKFVLSLAASSAALVVGAPATAQYAPPPGYGYQGNWGHARGFDARLDNIRRQIARLDRRDAIRGRAADRLMDEANRINRDLREHARNGLNPREAQEFDYRIQRLEQRVRYAMGNRYGWDRDRDHDRY